MEWTPATSLLLGLTLGFLLGSVAGSFFERRRLRRFLYATVDRLAEDKARRRAQEQHDAALRAAQKPESTSN